ncbi:MAG: FAD-binding oxidoreductase [Candidatus Acidiferrales bacterium]
MTTAINELFSVLRENFQGDLIRPGDSEYAEAGRIWNAMVARSPGLIARCADVADVQTAVRSAARAGVLTAVRCGGHSLAGFSSCDGGLVIDLSRMRQVSVDEKSRRARFAGGCLLGTVDSATQKAGLVFPAGVVSHTGASGLVLGGGTGWLTRLHGLSCDNVEGFTLVTADGSLVRANARENADLFWALRGGGGNFGVVTEFEVRLHPLSSLLLATSLCVGDDIVRVLRDWREFMPGASNNLKWNLSLRLAPVSENLPAGVRGKPALSVSMAWFGDPEEGHREIDRILSLGKQVARTKDEISYLALQTMADADFPHGRRYYTKSGFFMSLSDATMQTMIDALPSIPSPNTQIELAYLGGAAGRVGASETAFGDRSAPFIMNLLGDWSDPKDDAANVGWVRNLFGALRPAMKPGVYVNFMSGDEQERVPEAYHERWERMVKVKNHFDPTNFFRLNQNIKSQSGAAAAPPSATPPVTSKN